MSKKTRDLVTAALMLALTQLLPLLLAANVPAVAKVISPMHIPVFLCGLLCGMPWAPLVGFIGPLLRSVTVGMPALFPNALCMCFELATYGLISTLLRRALPKRTSSLYLALIGAMLCGRAIYGVVSVILYGFAQSPYTFQMFLSATFINAWPGIICHLILVPAIVMGLEHTNLYKGN